MRKWVEKFCSFEVGFGGGTDALKDTFLASIGNNDGKISLSDFLDIFHSTIDAVGK